MSGRCDSRLLDQDEWLLDQDEWSLRQRESYRHAVSNFEGIIGRTIHESQPHWPTPERADGDPNVVFVIFDDVGFSDFGCYGSEINTPTLDRLAGAGLRYRNFHTTGLCSATRASLLTGRNHHRVGMGTLADWDLGFPGSRGRVSRQAATLAEVLRPLGWNTFAVGKWHLTPMVETTGAGPYTDWPLARGFDRFYGFFDGETNHWKPELTYDNHRIPVPQRPDYHLTADLIDRSIEFIRDQKSVTPEKPFFLNLAFGACHAPHQAPASFIEPYVEVFADGYDAIRERRLAQQIDLGIVPEGTELTPRHQAVKPWAELSDDRKLTFNHLQAAYAGMLEHTDAELARLLTFLEHIDQLDNTIIFALSDNGASQEGSPLGTVNALRIGNGIRDSVERNLDELHLIGTEYLNNNYPLGWAMAGNTPLKRFKQNVHGGGVRDPLIVHWPAGGLNRGEIRPQFCHAVDVTPTVLDLIGADMPGVVNGHDQFQVDGTSFAPTLFSADAAPRTRPQLFELFGHRAIWHQEWKAVSFHQPGSSFEDDEWELYHLERDFSEANDLSASEPERLAAMVDLWWSEAEEIGVLPLDDRIFNERWVLSGKHQVTDRTRHRYWRGQAHLPTDAAPDIRDRSYRIDVDVELDAEVEGVLVAHGDRACGYALFILDGHLVHDYNAAGDHTVVRSKLPVPIAARTLSYRFTRTGDHQGLGELLVDGHVVGEAQHTATLPLILSFEGLDIGSDELVAVSPDYESPFPFSGRLLAVTYELGEDQGGREGSVVPARRAAEARRQ